MTTIPMHRRLALGCLALALAALAPAARASTAANTTITNTVSVAYQDADLQPQPAVTATVSFTVALKPSSPVLVAVAADDTVSQNQAVPLVYTVASSANGPDTYQVTASVVSSQMQATPTPTLPANLQLGGTTLAADFSGGNVITVPYDGVVATTHVNQLAPGDRVRINSNIYTIASSGTPITKSPGTNTATITLTTPLSGPAVLAGAIVGEVVDFTVSINSGLIVNVAPAPAQGTHEVSATVTSTTLGTATVSQGTATTVTVNRPMLTVTKAVSADGADFVTPVSAQPGTEVIYKIVVTNGGATTARSIVISDDIPAYLTFAGGVKVGSSAAATYADAGLTDVALGGPLSLVGTTLSYAAGDLSSTPGSNVLVFFFKAAVN